MRATQRQLIGAGSTLLTNDVLNRKVRLGHRFKGLTSQRR